MFIYPLALLLVIRAFHPRVDFGAGKALCMKMCQLGCSKNPREVASSCVEISHSGTAPWVYPYADLLQETFKYKWCQTKYQIAVVANDAVDEYYFQTIKYPATGLDYGPYKEVNHLNWIAPACNKTTAPSCKSIQIASTLADGLQWWLDNGGNDCRSLADAESCVEDCSTTCLKWCECGWGAPAEAAYDTGKMRRPQYDGTSGNWTCLEVYTFDKECTCSHGTPVDSKVCVSHGKEQCGACNLGYTLQNDSKACHKNICSCDRGQSVSTEKCFVHGATKCSENTCDFGFHFESDDCKANICQCRHGVAVASENCAAHLENHCQQCNTGFHLGRNNKECEANVCQCRHGAAVVGENCATHLENHCQLCKTGFHLSRNNKECEENICACDHGIPVAGQGCFVHGGTKCRENSCKPGYHMESDDCKGNICKCNFGLPVARQDCLAHGATKCGENTCDPGYHFESDDCKANLCQCRHGAAVASENCATHQENHCQQCNTGFHLSRNNKECEANVCQCRHGAAVAREHCTTHLENHCQQCNTGFHLSRNNKECEANVCQCRHGAAVAREHCTTHLENHCQQCNTGFHLSRNNKECEANVCQCRHGAPVVSENCATHLENHCQLCKTGFHLSRNNKECEENICTCDHGIPVAGQGCFVHGGTKCRENTCKPGYHMELDDCKENICTCDHGIPEAGRECSVHGGRKCRQNSCEPGYHMESDGCKGNICKCNYGLPVARQDCLTHGATKCAENTCYSGYRFESDNCKARECTTVVNPSEQMRSYSSVWQNDKKGYRHAQSRLDSPNAWCAGHFKIGEYLLLDLGKITHVFGTVVQGRAGMFANQWVKAYKVDYSTDKVFWQPVAGIFKGAAGRSRKYNYFTAYVLARYIRLIVLDWNAHPAMRAGAIACEACPSSMTNGMFTCLDGSQCSFRANWNCCAGHGGRMKCPPTNAFMCAKQDCYRNSDHCCMRTKAGCDTHDGLLLSCPVARECTTVVNPDERMRSYSSVWQNDAVGTGHALSRLNSRNAWCAGHMRKGEYVMLDLGKIMRVFGTVVQGRAAPHHNQWVTKYKVECSTNKMSWQTVESFFDGVQGHTASKSNYFPQPISARYIRLFVLAWQHHISFRAGAIACEADAS